MTMSRNSDASGAGDNKNIDPPASVTSNTKFTLNEVRLLVPSSL